MSDTIKVSVPADDIDALDAARAFFERVHSDRAALPGYPARDETTERRESAEHEARIDPADGGTRVDETTEPASAPSGSETIVTCAGPGECGDPGCPAHYAESETTESANGSADDPQTPEPPTSSESEGETTEPASPADDSDPELDKDGLPWDGRIHASTKKKTQDGRWKKKRGVDDETRQQVEAELRQLMDAPTPAEPSSAAPPPPPVNPESVDNSEGEPSGAAPPPPPANPESESGEGMDFPTFLEHVGEAVADQRISWERVNELCSEVTDGAVTKSALLSARTDLIPSVWARISQELGGNG